MGAVLAGKTSDDRSPVNTDNGRGQPLLLRTTDVFRGAEQRAARGVSPASPMTPPSGPAYSSGNQADRRRTYSSPSDAGVSSTTAGTTAAVQEFPTDIDLDAFSSSSSSSFSPSVSQNVDNRPAESQNSRSGLQSGDNSGSSQRWSSLPVEPEFLSQPGPVTGSAADRRVSSPENAEDDRTRIEAANKRITAIMRKLYRALIVLGTLFLNILLSSVAPILPDRFESYDIPVKWVGVVFMCCPVSLLFSSLCFGQLLDSPRLMKCVQEKGFAMRPCRRCCDRMQPLLSAIPKKRLDQLGKSGAKLLVYIVGVLVQAVAVVMFGYAERIVEKGFEFTPKSADHSTDEDDPRPWPDGFRTALVTTYCVSRVIQGLGAAATTMSLQSMMSSSPCFQRSELGSLNGLNEASAGVGYMLGPPMAAALAVHLGKFSAAFSIPAAGSVVVILPVVCAVWKLEQKACREYGIQLSEGIDQDVGGVNGPGPGESGGPAEVAEESGTGTAGRNRNVSTDDERVKKFRLFRFLRSGRILTPGLFLLYGAVIDGLMDAVFAVHLKDFLHFNTQAIGNMYLYQSFLYAGMSFFTGVLGDKIVERVDRAVEEGGEGTSNSLSRTLLAEKSRTKAARNINRLLTGGLLTSGLSLFSMSTGYRQEFTEGEKFGSELGVLFLLAVGQAAVTVPANSGMIEGIKLLDLEEKLKKLTEGAVAAEGASGAGIAAEAGIPGGAGVIQTPTASGEGVLCCASTTSTTSTEDSDDFGSDLAMLFNVFYYSGLIVGPPLSSFLAAQMGFDATAYVLGGGCLAYSGVVGCAEWISSRRGRASSSSRSILSRGAGVMGVRALAQARQLSGQNLLARGGAVSGEAVSSPKRSPRDKESVAPAT